jgi:hypothetical protein
MANGYLQVKNWERFQHYRDRNPPWIKFYGELLEDYEFSSLPDEQKAHVVLIWLLASRTNNKIPNDAAWISARISATSPLDLDLLTRAGFIEPWAEDAAKGKREDWASRYIKPEVRAEVMKRDGKKCVACNSKKNLEIDHITPISKGGTGEAGNLQVLCRPCNRRKRTSGAVPAEQVATQENKLRSLEGETEAEAETETETETKEIKQTDLLFEAVWLEYPRKTGKQSALKAWNKLIVRGDPKAVEAGILRYTAYVKAQGTEQQFIKHLATLLNSGDWQEAWDIPNVIPLKKPDPDEWWLNERIV